MASDSSSRPFKRLRKNDDQEGTEQSAEKACESSPTSGKNPLVVFAHGAGAPSTSEWMIRWKKMLGEALGAVEVITFDYPYISGGKRRAPPKAEKLVDHHLEVVKAAVQKHPGHPLVLVGKSMGSRVSCMVASARDISISAIVCLGYPLKVFLKSPMFSMQFIALYTMEGINGSVRDETLLQLTIPTMFVQGSKDSLCPIDKLDSTMKKMKCGNNLHVIDGGDHSFKIGKKFLESSGYSQDDAERRAVRAVMDFVIRAIKGELI
ncbi:KAT8 regulatory NSL complex subunit 3 isoform X1 [Phalaenopsis equestris]|uniref:KAT8 regulatory NSL complex subunit 3 isoform X1 n=1 Tax=Phalaenopsis equestris TaxID=78828 RepID=UPI0009E604E4|nr:KAT8 regulatory NSL complex subunit 3 isoform X1 [Phalaenopsis equestris]